MHQAMDEYGGIPIFVFFVWVYFVCIQIVVFKVNKAKVFDYTFTNDKE